MTSRTKEITIRSFTTISTNIVIAITTNPYAIGNIVRAITYLASKNVSRTCRLIGKA
jgi:hypothetical protein